MIPCGADSALYPLRGREIGFQATEDSRSASRRLERPRASAEEDSPEFLARARVGQRRGGEGKEQGLGAEIEGWRKRGAEREKEELLDFPQLHSRYCACHVINSNNKFSGSVSLSPFYSCHN